MLKTGHRSARVLLLLSLLLSACATAPYSEKNPDRLLLRDGDTGVPRQELSFEEVEKDLDTLLLVLKHGYAGRKLIDQAQFTAALSKLKTLAGAKPYSSASLRDAIDEVLLELPDNHLAARLWTGEESPKRVASEPKSEVGENVLKDDAKAWQLSFRKAGKKKIPVIAIRRFADPKDDVWKGFKEAASKVLRKSPALILDIRGNGGGSSVMAYWLAKEIFGYTPLTAVAGYQKSLTPATLALFANNPKYKILRAIERKKPVPAYLLEDYQRRFKLYEEAKAGKLPGETFESEDEAKPEKRAPVFPGPIFVLIDSGCMSACEDMLEALERHPNLFTVGQNTAGSVHFGNMGFLALPHSRVLIQLATMAVKYRDGRFVEKRGYAPRIRVSSGNDAMDVALHELTAKLQSPLKSQMRIHDASSIKKVSDTF